MPSAPTSKAVLAVPSVGDKWHLKRLHRRLDNRDEVLEAALQLIEEWDPAVFPAISKIVGFAYNKSASASDVVLSVVGADFTAGSAITVTLGGTEVTPTRNVGAQTLTLPGAAVNTITDDAANPIGTQLMLMVRIDNVLLPPVAMTVILA